METLTGQSARKQYLSKSQKEQILKEHLEQGTPISQLARKNGINAVTIYLWKRNMKNEDDTITPAKIRELLLENSTLKNENRQLKFKVADLAVTNDILTEAIDISKKRELLKQVQLLEKSKAKKNSR